jgi:transcriptional regulator
MYIPKHNLETRIERIDGLIRAHPLATLVSNGPLGLFATHLPLVLHRASEEHAVLRGHLARANPQWKDLAAQPEALVIFQGPEHYITPAWYPEKTATGKVVPTWNYTAVHAYGPVRIVEDAAWLLEHLNTLTDTHEIARAEPREPWNLSDAPADFVVALARGIVGIELEIARLEGKWKVSQNQNEATRASVARGLEGLGTESSLAMRDLVEG